MGLSLISLEPNKTLLDEFKTASLYCTNLQTKVILGDYIQKEKKENKSQS